MVELFEQDERQNNRQSSKGNQLKWENEGIWYKADYTGYEGLVEYMISHLLKKSSLAENEFVCYDLEEIKYGTVIYNGVKSPDFLGKGWQIITLERLFRNFFGESLQMRWIEQYREKIKSWQEELRNELLKNIDYFWKCMMEEYPRVDDIPMGLKDYVYTI